MRRSHSLLAVLLPALLLALSALPPDWRAYSSPIRTTSPESCYHIKQLALDHHMPAFVLSVLLRYGRDCPALIEDNIAHPTTLRIQRRLETFPWSPSSTAQDASKQLGSLYDALFDSDAEAELVPHFEQAAAAPNGTTGAPPAPTLPSADVHETHEAVPYESRAEGGRAHRQLSSSTCAFQNQNSGTHSVLSDCDQGSTVSVSASMQVQGVGGMPEIDRGRGGHHFTVEDSGTLTLRSVRLVNGEAIDGGIVLVYGTLSLEQVLMSGGKSTSRYGGAIYATGNQARVQARDSTFSSNTADMVSSCTLL